MDDERPARKDYPLTVSKMSKTPSWILLGFVLGAAFVLTFNPRRPRPAPPVQPAVTEPAKPAVPREPPPLSLIEAVFEKEGQAAVWSGDTTEVALWVPAEERYADFYEVRRIDGKLYFRSIPALTRRIIMRGKPQPDALLQFTETEEQFREWEEYGRRERPFERMWQKPNRPAANSVPAPTLPSMPAPKLEITPPPINPTLPPPSPKKAETPPAR
jgi:hypothetical protein